MNLSNNELITIPTEIGNLVKLLELKLAENNLTTIPLEIGKLVNLEVLNLGGNELTTLPTEIGFLLNLESLNIIRTNLTTIPQAICNLMNYNNLEIVIDHLFSCETTSPNDALISIYSANPNNTLNWEANNFPGVTFDSQRSIIEIDLRNKGIEHIKRGVVIFEFLELLDLRDNPLVSIHNDVCALTFTSDLTILADIGEGCN